MRKPLVIFFALLAALVAGAANVEGVITFQRAADPYFFMETPSGVVWRVQRNTKEPRVAIGDIVSAGGSFIKDIATPRFKANTLKILGHDESRVPMPERVALAELLVDPIADKNAVNRYGRLVTVEGIVRDVNRRQTYMQVGLGDGSGIVQAVIPFKIERQTPEDLVPGARVRVSGVYVYGSVLDPVSREWTGIETPSVLAAREADCSIVSSAPFWTPAKFWTLIGGILLAAGILVFWVRSRERAEADAVRRERLRLSHDLHDGLQQLLAGSMFRLEAAMNFLPEDAVEAREQLEKVSDSLYHTQTGLRAALWSMNEESEGPRSLSGLVRYAAGRLAHWEGVVDITFRGEERHVPSAISGEILMALQESVGNALRHGAATKVKVRFSFRKDCFTISIRDNGRGFDVSKVDMGAGHLGIRSLRDRAAHLGGTMQLKSEPGRGTIVVFKLPYGGAK